MEKESNNTEERICLVQPTDCLVQPSDCVVGLVDDVRCEGHFQTPTHPESPDRVRAIRLALKLAGLYDLMVKIPVRQHKPNDMSTFKELYRVHPFEYVRHVLDVCSRGQMGMVSNSSEVIVNNPGSLPAILTAAAGVAAAVRAVLDPVCAVQRAFCNVRPPGHHASVEKAMGFCVFNNVAVGALEALAHPGVSRVAIIDWDVHHGNGSQDIFQDNPNVIYLSVHQGFGFYPKTGHAKEQGSYKQIHNYNVVGGADVRVKGGLVL